MDKSTDKSMDKSMGQTAVASAVIYETKGEEKVEKFEVAEVILVPATPAHADFSRQDIVLLLVALIVIGVSSDIVEDVIAFIKFWFLYPLEDLKKDWNEARR